MLSRMPAVSVGHEPQTICQRKIIQRSCTRQGTLGQENKRETTVTQSITITLPVKFCTFIHLSIYHSIHLSICPSIYLPIHPSICLFVHLSICLCTCTYIYIYLYYTNICTRCGYGNPINCPVVDRWQEITMLNMLVISLFECYPLLIVVQKTWCS